MLPSSLSFSSFTSTIYATLSNAKTAVVVSEKTNLNVEFQMIVTSASATGKVEAKGGSNMDDPRPSLFPSSLSSSSYFSSSVNACLSNAKTAAASSEARLKTEYRKILPEAGRRKRRVEYCGLNGFYEATSK